MHTPARPEASDPTELLGSGAHPRSYTGQMDELLTVGEVAGLLRVSTMTVYRLIRTGELPAVRVGRNYRVRRNDLDTYLQEKIVEPERAADQ